MSNNTRPLILIVDDDEQLARMMEVALNHADLAAHAVFSGTEALAWLTTNTPAAIILDLMMPDINGFAILRQLRSNEITRPLPVIVLTARADHQSRQETQSAGANLFLTKPVDTHVLVEHIRRALVKPA